MAAEIPAKKVSRGSAFVSFSGSWFHSLILDGKKDSLYVLVLQYGTELVLVTSCSSTQKLKVFRGWYSYHGHVQC